MSLITLQGAGFDYGRQTILEAENLTIDAGERYGLVGVNGAGKSTLMRLLNGELSLVRGRIERAGRVSLGILPQDTHLESDEPLREAVRRAAFGELLQIEKRLSELGDQLASGDEKLLEEYGRLHERFEAADGYSMESRTDAALHGLGFELDRLDQPVRTLSGGQKRRAALAAVLLAPHDLLLLDEPTNHLDLEAREWLEEHLANRNTAIVAISHDRTFLDHATQYTLHLLNGRLSRYTGGYTRFLVQWAEHKELWEAQYRRQQDHIARTEAFIRKNIAGVRTNQAKSRRKQLERLDRVEAPPNAGRALRFNLKPSRASASVVYEGHGLAMQFGKLTLFDALELQVLRGEKIGILGPNGTGKSTLLKLLARVHVPTHGRVVQGGNVDLGYFDQDLKLVSDGNTVYDEIRLQRPDLNDESLRTLLAAFHFGEDMIDQQIRTLSGGERARLSLLKLILERHNTLLLDEPTNHLDVDTREALEEALVDFDGTLIVVSHDRYFLNRICNRIVAFESKAGGGTAGVRQVLGNYDDYRRKLKEARETPTGAKSPTKPVSVAAVVEPAPSAQLQSPGKASVARQSTRRRSTPTGASQPRSKQELSKNELAKLRREIADLEDEITFLELEIETLTGQMSGGASGSEMAELARRAAELRGKLEAKTARWEEYTQLLERDSSSRS